MADTKINNRNFGKSYTFTPNSKILPAQFQQETADMSEEDTNLHAMNNRIDVSPYLPKETPMTSAPSEPSLPNRNEVPDSRGGVFGALTNKPESSVEVSPLTLGTMALMGLGSGIGSKVGGMVGRYLAPEVAPAVTGLLRRYAPREGAGLLETLFAKAGEVAPIAGATLAQTGDPYEAAKQALLAGVAPNIVTPAAGVAPSRWVQGMQNMGVNTVAGGVAAGLSGQSIPKEAALNAFVSAGGDFIGGTMGYIGEPSKTMRAIGESPLLPKGEYASEIQQTKAIGNRIIEAAPRITGTGRTVTKGITDPEIDMFKQSEIKRLESTGASPEQIKAYVDVTDWKAKALANAVSPEEVVQYRAMKEPLRREQITQRYIKDNKPIDQAQIQQELDTTNWEAEAKEPYMSSVGSGVNIPRARVAMDTLEYRKLEEPKIVEALKRENWGDKTIQEKLSKIDWEERYLEKTALQRSVNTPPDFETVQSMAEFPIDPEKVRKTLQTLPQKGREFIKDIQQRERDIYKDYDELRAKGISRKVKVDPRLSDAKGNLVYNAKETGDILQDYLNAELASKKKFADNIFSEPYKVLTDTTGRMAGIEKKELTLSQLLDVQKILDNPKSKIYRTTQNTDAVDDIKRFAASINNTIKDLRASNPEVNKLLLLKDAADVQKEKLMTEFGRQRDTYRAGITSNFPEKDRADKIIKAQTVSKKLAGEKESFQIDEEPLMAKLLVDNPDPEAYAAELKKNYDIGNLSETAYRNEISKVEPYLGPENAMLRRAYKKRDFSEITDGLKSGNPTAVNVVERIYKTPDRPGATVANQDIARKLLNDSVVDILADTNNYNLMDSKGQPYRVYKKEEILKKIDSILRPTGRPQPIFSSDVRNPLVEMEDFFSKKKNIAEVGLGTLSTLFNSAKENQAELWSEILNGGWANNVEQAREWKNNLKYLPEGDKILQEAQHAMLAGTFVNKMGGLDPERAANFAVGKKYDPESKTWVTGSDFSVDAAKEILTPEQIPIFDEAVKIGKVLDNLRSDPKEYNRMQALSLGTQVGRGATAIGAASLGTFQKLVNAVTAGILVMPEQWGAWILKEGNLPLFTRMLTNNILRPAALTIFKTRQENQR